MITKPTEADVARARDLPGWAWADGMLIIQPNPKFGRTDRYRLWFRERGRIDPEEPTFHPRTHARGVWQLGNNTLPDNANTLAFPPVSWFPDLEDPATGGALLALLCGDKGEGDGSAWWPLGDALEAGWALGEWAVWVALHRGYWIRPQPVARDGVKIPPSSRMVGHVQQTEGEAMSSINVEDLTLRQIREIQDLVPPLAKPNSTSAPHPYVIGVSVFIRTVSYHYTGRVAAVYPGEIVLTDAAWVADSGRWSVALTTGLLTEVEPYPGEVIISRGSIVDVSRWLHPLPRTVK